MSAYDPCPFHPWAETSKGCLICRVDAIALLLETGRPHHALRLVRTLEDGISEVVDAAWADTVGRVKATPKGASRKRADLDPTAGTRRRAYHTDANVSAVLRRTGDD
jgi:hypothetical protein